MYFQQFQEQQLRHFFILFFFPSLLFICERRFKSVNQIYKDGMVYFILTLIILKYAVASRSLNYIYKKNTLHNYIRKLLIRFLYQISLITPFHQSSNVKGTYALVYQPECVVPLSFSVYRYHLACTVIMHCIFLLQDVSYYVFRASTQRRSLRNDGIVGSEGAPAFRAKGVK